MKFYINYKNNYFYLYDFYYDIIKQNYAQIFTINENNDIILKYKNGGKIIYNYEYLKFLIKK